MFSPVDGHRIRFSLHGSLVAASPRSSSPPLGPSWALSVRGWARAASRGASAWSLRAGNPGSRRSTFPAVRTEDWRFRPTVTASCGSSEGVAGRSPSHRSSTSSPSPGTKLDVSSPDGAISPRSWGGPGGAYVTGYLPPSKGRPEPFGPIGVARIAVDGRIGQPTVISTTDRGCQLTSPLFIPGSADIAVVEDCDAHVPSGGNEWATSTRILRVDPKTGRVVGVIARLPPGLDIGEPELDSSGNWIVFGASTNNAQGTAEGEFILHDGRCWRVPNTGSLGSAIWR